MAEFLNIFKRPKLLCSARVALQHFLVLRSVGFPTAMGESSAQAFLFIPSLPIIPTPNR